MSSLIDRIRSSLTERRDLQTGLAAAAKVAKAKLDALEIFRPTSYQEQVVLCDATEILVQGGTRSGKSMIVAAIIASYLRNKPITFADGSKHHMREPAWMGRATTVWLCGLQLNHIGQTLYRLLCKPGAFDMVRDKETGMWRAWQPGRIPGDDTMSPDERKPAPPFIPSSELQGKPVWENAAANEFKSMTMKDGSIVYAFASTGNVKRGDPCSRIWIDEELASDADHYQEFQSRLSDRKGRIYWSTWPNMKTPSLLALKRRCDDQREECQLGTRSRPDVVNFVFRGSDSPFIDADEKRKRAEGWTDEQRRARDFGEFVVDNIQAYPEFNKRYHCVDYGDNSPLNDKVTEAMRKLNWNVPHTWSVDLILDPGTQRPALLWGAIPPPEFWDDGEPYFVIFREMAIPRIDAREMAKRTAAADQGRHYARFIGDSKAGGQTPMGFSWTVFDQYTREFQQEGLRCQLTGDMFLRSETVWVTRSMKLRKWMRSRKCGRPQLRVVPHMCPVLCRQLETVLKKVSKEDIQDKLADGQVHDVLDCFTPDMEVLTDVGWKRWDEVSHSSKLATISPDDRVEYQTPSRWVVNDYDGPLVNFESRSVSCSVTPNHRMLVYTQGNRKTWRVLPADSIPSQNLLKVATSKPVSTESPEYYDLTGVVTEGRSSRNAADKVLLADFAELLGWWVAEGSMDKVIRMPGVGYRVQISQRKPEGVKALRELLDRLPWKFLQDGDGFMCSSKQLWTLITSMGLGDRAYNKRIPQLVRESSQAVIEAFLRGYYAGDGWDDNQGGKMSASVSWELSSGIQELNLLLGNSASIITRSAVDWNIAGRSGKSRDQFWVIQKERKVASLVNGKKDSIVTNSHYQGKVYCATVPNGTLVVRRNGKVLMAGNCLEYWAGFDPEFLATPPTAGPVDPGRAAFDADQAYLARFFKQGDKKEKGPIVLGVP